MLYPLSQSTKVIRKDKTNGADKCDTTAKINGKACKSYKITLKYNIDINLNRQSSHLHLGRQCNARPKSMYFFMQIHFLDNDYLKEGVVRILGLADFSSLFSIGFSHTKSNFFMHPSHVLSRVLVFGGFQ